MCKSKSSGFVFFSGDSGRMPSNKIVKGCFSSYARSCPVRGTARYSEREGEGGGAAERERPTKDYRALRRKSKKKITEL